MDFGHYFDPETKYIHSHKNSGDMDDRGVGYALFTQMQQHAADGLYAQIDALTGHKDSFESFLKRSIRVAISMQKSGIKPGDVITICSYNHMNSAVPYVAGQFIGAIVAPTDPTISVEDQRYLLNLVKPKMLFVSAGAENLIENALSGLEFACEIITFARSNKHRSFHMLLEKQEDEDEFESLVCEDPTATCVILFSSGTTGLPKGICINHYFIMNIFPSMSNLKPLKPKFLLYSSLYWISAVGFQTICFYFGFERLVCTYFEPQLMWQYINDYKVNVLFLAPVQAIQALKYLYKKPNSHLKMIALGGSSIAPNYLQSLRNALPTTLVVNGYGQTEVGFISLFKKSNDDYLKLTSVGYLSANIIAKIVDPDTEEVLGLKQEGEIRLKTTYPMNGYYNVDTSSVWDAEGFIKTGDMGYFDEQLCLYITDRIKEMFKYMSWHIVPAKLEGILQEHPDVQLAIVVGIPHPTEDNHAAAAVTLLSHATVTAEELENYVARRVDDRNRLRAGVIIMDEMPLSPTGKILRRKMKEIMKSKIKLY